MDKLSPKIIRVWFDTILNPFIDGLSTEKIFLEKNNLTWRGFTNTFEILKPLHTMYHYRYHANFEQFVAYFPIVLEIIDKHDSNLESLNKECNNLFQSLKNSDILKITFDNIVEKFPNTILDIDNSKLNYFKDNNNYRYISEYIINNKGDLESSYILSPIWNSNKEIFLDILNITEFNLLVKNKDLALHNFKMVVLDSIISLKDIRNKLSIQYGEPIVMVIEQ